VIEIDDMSKGGDGLLTLEADREAHHVESGWIL
jgi:hypothetical protein